MATSSITSSIVLSDSVQTEKFLNAFELSVESRNTRKVVVSGRQLSERNEIKAFIEKRSMK